MNDQEKCELVIRVMKRVRGMIRRNDYFHICGALFVLYKRLEITHNEQIKLRDAIMKGLQGQITVEGWLRMKILEGYKTTKTAKQVRLAWIDAIIASHEEYLKKLP